MTDPRFDKLAELLVAYSAAVEPGDVVGIAGPSQVEAFLLALYREVLRAGGHPMMVMTPIQCLELLYQYGSHDQLAFVNPLEECEVETVDVAIHVLAEENPRVLASVDLSRQALRNLAQKPLMERFMRRATERSLHWLATPFPCPGAAQDAGMTLAEYADLIFRAALLDRMDPAAAWQTLSVQQQCLADYLNGVQELRLVTATGTDVRVGVGGRNWINCDGHENFPDGEVFTGPVEQATEGIIYFSFPTIRCGRRVEGIRLVFRAGKVVDASADRGEEFLMRVLDQEPSARILGEVAFGCNYALTRHTCQTILDEKIGGTFHVALGASYPASGGRNESSLHWDLVCDLRPGSQVQADGRVIMENGRFTNPEWPNP